MFLERTKMYTKVDGSLRGWQVDTLDYKLAIEEAKRDLGKNTGDNKAPFLAVIENVPFQKTLF